MYSHRKKIIIISVIVFLLLYNFIFIVHVKTNEITFIEDTLEIADCSRLVLEKKLKVYLGIEDNQEVYQSRITVYLLFESLMDLHDGEVLIHIRKHSDLDSIITDNEKFVQKVNDVIKENNLYTEFSVKIYFEGRDYEIDKNTY